MREAYSFNQPLDSAEITAARGDLPESFSLVSCDTPNVILETAKKAEADNGLIVRLYECHNSRGNAAVTAAEGFRKAYLCDMMENILEEIPFDGHAVTVPVKNFEIITLKFAR